MLHFRFSAILLAINLLLVDVSTSHAQPYYFRHYQVENGLSNSTVFCTLQDKRGFLWFGTKEGLNRFDGYHFKLFTHKHNNIPSPPPPPFIPAATHPTPGVSITLLPTARTTPSPATATGSDLIYCLFSDQQGTMWVGGQNGLFRFDEQNENLVPINDSLKEINWIQTDDKGYLWFLSYNSVWRYNLRTKALTHFPEKDNFYATSICRSDSGDIWFTANDGVIKKYDEPTGRFISYDLFKHSPQPSSRWLTRIRYAGNHLFLIGTTNQGLKTFNESTGAYEDILIYNPDKTTIFVRDILQYAPSEFWLGTESGVFIIDLTTHAVTNLRKKFLDPYSLSDNAVYSLCKDSEGGVWVGTFFGGVNYYSRQYSSFHKYYPDNSATSISGSAVREITQDKYNNMWIGTEDAGLNKLDPATGAITHFMPSGSFTDIDYTNIHGLLAVGNDLWIGTFEHGLDVMDIRSGKVKRRYFYGDGPNHLKSNFVLCLIRTRSGQILMGTSNQAFAYREKTDDFEPLPGVPPSTFVASLLEDHEGTIWVGTHGRGVYYYNPVTGLHGHFEGHTTSKDSTTPRIDMINAIDEDSHFNIWFSTEGEGAWRLAPDRKTFTDFTTANGLPSDFIFNVIEDDNRDVWLTTSKGLVNLRQGNGPATVYTKSNGLLNDQFNYSSGFKDHQGRLWFGSVKGMITFHPNDFVLSGFTPPVYITGFQVDNKELPISKDSSFLHRSTLFPDKIILPYDQSSFSIDFAALSYASPERIEYMYKMDNLDHSWTWLKANRKVYFTNLSPGKYRFRIKAAVNGVWNDQEKDLPIEVRPPLWATPIAYTLYILLIGLLVGYIVVTYHRRTQVKKEKEIYEAKIDFFTNIAHEIRTPLTLIKGPTENLKDQVDHLPEIKEDVVTMERNTNRLIALVNQILDFRQTETRGFSLDFTRVNITSVMQEHFLNFSAMAKKKNLDYQFEHPDNDIYTMADEEALNKIFSNLFSNAIKYSQQIVRIRLYQNDALQTIVAEISNDGPLIPPDMKERIFEPFYRLKGNAKQKGTGIGLALARSLAELHKGRIYVDYKQPGLNTFVFILSVN